MLMFHNCVSFDVWIIFAILTFRTFEIIFNDRF